MTVLAVIPARFSSTRFPGKPLAKTTGKYLVQHVYEQAVQCRSIDRVVVATDNQRIAAAVKSFGGEFCMTRSDHVSGTDRVAEAAASIGVSGDDIVLNIQGDEPEIEPSVLDRVIIGLAEDRTSDPKESPPLPYGRGSVPTEITPLPYGRGSVSSECSQLPYGCGSVSLESSPGGTSQCRIATPATPFDDKGPRNGPGSPLDPNCVKVVVDATGKAMYFSRSPIPHPRRTGGVIDRPSRWLLHMGVYAFRADTLAELTKRRSPGALEEMESLEQLRWLEQGYSIRVVIVDHASVGIDTPEDYAAFVERTQRTSNRINQTEEKAGAV